MDWPADYENAESYGLRGKPGERRGVVARAVMVNLLHLALRCCSSMSSGMGGTDWMINSWEFKVDDESWYGPKDPESCRTHFAFAISTAYLLLTTGTRVDPSNKSYYHTN